MVSSLEVIMIHYHVTMKYTKQVILLIMQGD